MNFKKFISLLATVVLAVSAFAGCSSNESSSNVIASGDGVQVEIVNDSSASEETDTESEAMNVAMLKGPTAIGAVMLMKAQDEGTAEGNYNFTIDTAPDSVVSKVISGEVDVAAVPSNSAAAIYNKTEGGVVVAAVNTLGTLYLIENGDTINSVSDLAGKTINSSGQGAVPEYVLNYILAQSGTENVTVNFMQAHDELAAAVASGEVDNALLPEPYVEVALAKNPDLRVALDIAQCYDEYSGVEKGEMPNTLPMGCIIIRKEYAESHPEEVK